MDFYSLGLSDKLSKTIVDHGYTVPTPIQQKAIPQVLCGRDLFACAQTGTGKTAAFVLPMIDIIDSQRMRSNMPRAIILEPTRELATQVYENFVAYNKSHDLKAVVLVGGESMFEQDKILKKGVDILIATPGRLLDLFERGKLLLQNVHFFVIDEADRMLDMGFMPDVERIVAMIPQSRQTLFFSATMPDEIKKIAAKFLNNPREIVITPSARTADTVTQYMVKTPHDDKTKRQYLRKILKEQNCQGPVIIFSNRKSVVDIISKSLKHHGYNAECLHGDMPQTKRNETLEDFKAGKFSVLVASDVAARGLDVTDLALVVNYDVPINSEDYVHRIGRTGRAGKSGIAIMLVSDKDKKRMQGVESLIKQKIDEMKVVLLPEDVEEKRPARQSRSTSENKRSVSDRPGRMKRHEMLPDDPSGPVVGFGEFVPAFMNIKFPEL